MILPPPLLFSVSTAFLKFVLIDFNLAETRSFVIESKSLQRGNFSSSTSTSTLSAHTSFVLIPSSQFIITFCFEIKAYFKKKLNFIIRPIKIRCFPVLLFTLLTRHCCSCASQKSNKQKTPKNLIFCHQDSLTHLFFT